MQYAVSDKLSDESASQFHVHTLLLPCKPDAVSGSDVCMAQINVCSAYGLLARLAAPKGAWILQNAAGSVMGRQIIQIAKHQVRTCMSACAVSGLHAHTWPDV